MSDHKLSEESADWLSLQEASAALGVATSTLRRWGDEGRVPMKRTLGGHRRFARSAIGQLIDQHTPPAAPAAVPAPVRPWGVDENELSRQKWHAQLAHGAHTDRMRGLGQRLLGLLIQYINRPDDGRFLEEAGGVGGTYGLEACGSAVSLHDTVQAFLFFRGAFAQLAMPLPGIAQPTDLEEAAVLHRRIDRFMDAVLLGVIRGYETARGQTTTCN